MGPRTQPLAGFEDHFVDIVDYIVRITHRIWVDRAIGYIYDTYDANCVVYSALGTIRSVEDVVANTLQAISASGDGESHHLNVAWSGDEQEGFYTSHLGFAYATNTGPTIFGPATGRRTGRFFVADCITSANRIHTEWLMRDNGALVRQMGFDPHDVARRLASECAGEQSIVAVPNRLNGQAVRDPYGGPTDTVRGWMDQHFDAWNRRRFDLLAEHYAPGVIAHWCGGRTAQGQRGVMALIMRLLASLPTSSVRLEHVSWAEETDGVIVAARWTLEGWTCPGGMLGEVPRGKPAAIMGATHFRFRGGKIVEEWTVFDEIGTLAQIYRA
jgi:predicted ester cyclase